MIYIAIAALALSLAACSGVPKVATPSGNNRVPINSEAALSDYQIRAARDDEERKLAAKLTELESQVRLLKAYIARSVMEEEANTPKGLPDTRSKDPAQKNRPAKRDSTHDQKGIDSPLVFTVTHPVGQTAFNPPEVIKTRLLQAALASPRIEIRGRTDSYRTNPADREIAKNRALRAYAFLVRNGIPADRIKVSYQSAGGFVADNSTPYGKAKNRRVEIEAAGVGTTALKTEGAHNG